MRDPGNEAAPFAHGRGAIVQFDWLLARQSKYDIGNLSFMHNPTSGTQQDQNRYGRVRRSVRRRLRIFCSGSETPNDLSQNGKIIVLKAEEEAAISF